MDPKAGGSMAETPELVESFRRLVPLAGAGDPAAAGVLLGALIDRDHRRQAFASRALHAVPAERFWRLVVEYLATGRWRGVHPLAPLTVLRRQKLRQHLHALLSLHHDPASDAARQEALVAALRDGSAPVRACAADILGERHATEAATALIRALGDPAPAVRIHAARALGRLEHPGAVRPLTQTLSHRNDALAGAAVDALVHIGQPAVPTLIEACASSDEWVRWHAVRALGRLHDPRAIPSLVELLGDTDAAVRWAAVRALQHRGRPAVEAVVYSLIVCAITPVVADAAGHVLRQVKDRGLADAVRPLADHLRDTYAGVSVPPMAERVLLNLRAAPSGTARAR
jgi:HEAT repeat protein